MWAPGSSSQTDQAVSIVARSIKTLHKQQDAKKSTTSLINSKKSNFQFATTEPEFDAIRPKTLSELEEDLDKLLEDTKQETTIDGDILSSGCQQDIIQEEQPINSVSTTTNENYLKDLM